MRHCQRLDAILFSVLKTAKRVCIVISGCGRTMVTLREYRVSSLTIHHEWASRYSQSADAEHGGYANLLLPMKLEGSQLPERDTDDPYVDTYTHPSIRPGDCIGVQASARVHTVPFGPEVRYGTTLENGSNNEGKTPGGDKDDWCGDCDHVRRVVVLVILRV